MIDVKGIVIGQDALGLPIIRMIEDVKKGEWFWVGHTVVDVNRGTIKLRLGSKKYN